VKLKVSLIRSFSSKFERALLLKTIYE